MTCLESQPHGLYGGDYNPEQWPEAVWAEDVRLMARPASTSSRWASSPGHCSSRGPASYGRLAGPAARSAGRAQGIHADLATGDRVAAALASPLTPRACRSPADGRRLAPGSRQHYCPRAPRLTRCRRAPRRARMAAATGSIRPSRSGTSATNTAATSPPATAITRAEAVPGLAPGALRLTRWAQRGLGQRGLEPGLQRLGPDPAAARRPSLRQSRAAARLARFSSDELLALFPDGARMLERHAPGHAGHHELHVVLPPGRPLALGAPRRSRRR